MGKNFGPFNKIIFAVVVLFSSFSFAGTKDITGVNRAKLIQALYKRAKVQGYGVLQFDRGELSDAEALSLVGQGIDYLHGKVMKIRVPAEGQGNEIDTWGYNRDNGENAAEQVVDALLKSGSVADAAATGPAHADPEIVELKNGATYPAALALIGITRVRSLARSSELQDLLALYELTMKCRNPSHKFFGNLGERLKSLGLVEQDGSIQDYISDIVLSAISGNEMELRYSNPIVAANTLQAFMGGSICGDLLKGR
jgi:hypothetical protein